MLVLLKKKERKKEKDPTPSFLPHFVHRVFYLHTYEINNPRSSHQTFKSLVDGETRLKC